jgi:N-acetyl-gamma-glutamyl-phosphate reductase
MGIRVGILGVGGYGGGEILRLCSVHPEFEIVHISGETSAGKKLSERHPGVHHKLADRVIENWSAEAHQDLDLLFASLPTGASRGAFEGLGPKVKVVDIGGDHRYADGWVYGLADVWPEKIRGSSRISNPGCYPSAALIAIAPLIAAKIAPADSPIVIDAKSGVSGAGRGGESKFGFAEVNEDVSAYGLLKHAHVPEIASTVKALGAAKGAHIVFTPHLIPMTRGILATCYLQGKATTEDCLQAAQKFYAGRAFVRVTEQPPHTKWATGSNLAFVSYASAGDGSIIALGAIDNLGKGAAGQAVQNANLMFGLPETTGLEGAPLWP